MRNFFLTIAAIAVSGLILSGCGGDYGGETAGEGRIVARINNYKMSVTDFKDGIDLILSRRYLSVEPDEAKEELLDELITKKVLLQEAQKQNFDKEKTFMKEIERYWEQSLLKLLFEKKSDQIREDVRVEESDVIDEYRRMKRRIFAELVILNDKTAAEKLSRATDDDFNSLKENFKRNIISGEEPGWWVPGDLPRYLEDPLFSLRPGAPSPIIKCGNNWAVIKVLKEEDNMGIEPFKKVSSAIKRNILKRKEEEAIEEWIKDLRKKAVIKINKKVLNRIKLE